MSRNIRILFIILSLIFVVFTWRVILFYYDVNTASRKDEPVASTLNRPGDELYSFTDSGLYGMKNGSGKIVIEARWNTIEKLGTDRFVVSEKSENKKYRYGIIDSAENIIVPFIYTSIENLSNEFLCGTTEAEKYVLFDNSGNILINEEWESVSKNYNLKSLNVSGNYIQVIKEDNIYRISYEEGKFAVKELILSKDVFNEKRQIKLENTSVSSGTGETIKLYNELFDRGIDYINAVFSNDSASVKALSWNEEYKDILLEGLNLRGSTIVYADTPVPVITDTESGNIDYSCSTTVVYASPENINWDGSYTSTSNAVELEILMKKKQNGKLAVYKVHAHKTDVPDEYKKVSQTAE